MYVNGFNKIELVPVSLDGRLEQEGVISDEVVVIDRTVIDVDDPDTFRSLVINSVFRKVDLDYLLKDARFHLQCGDANREARYYPAARGHYRIALSCLNALTAVYGISMTKEGVCTYDDGRAVPRSEIEREMEEAFEAKGFLVAQIYNIREALGG